MKHLLIGLDDIDSYSGGCTTHFATYILEKTLELGGYLTDYPRLIRLNPDTPWRTRGNGAVALEVVLPDRHVSYLLDWLERALHKYILLNDGLRPGTQPGIIILDGNSLNRSLYRRLYIFSSKALYKIISFEELDNILNSLGNSILKSISPYGKRGLIGSLAAIGNFLPFDHTYELIVYRKLSERGKERDIDLYPDIEMEDEYSFAHVDLETNKALWTPHGPDPVIIGIRGDRVSKVLGIFNRIEKYLSYDRWVIYVTNQGTNEHFKQLLYNKQEGRDPFNQYLGVFEMLSHPIRDVGGHIHVYGKMNNDTVEVMVYEPSSRLREIIEKLKPSDRVILGGVFKFSRDATDLMFNTQVVYFGSTPLSRDTLVKPICPKCGSKMESLGRGSGYHCEKCKYHIKEPHTSKIYRSLWVPHLSLPPYRSIRHISKPLKRYGREHKYRFKGLRSNVFFYVRDK